MIFINDNYISVNSINSAMEKIITMGENIEIIINWIEKKREISITVNDTSYKDVFANCTLFKIKQQLPSIKPDFPVILDGYD